MSDIPTGTPRRIHVDSTWILRRYVEDQISTSFHVISAYVFDVILMVEKSTSFPRTFFDVISLVKKSALFSRTFFDVILMVENSTYFYLETTTYFFRCNFDGRNMHLVFTYFFDLILMGKNLTSFLVSCKLMKILKKIFPVFVTLNS